MIELNLLERKEKVKLPVVAGLDLNFINIPAMIGAVAITFGASYYYTSYFEEIIAKEEAISTSLKDQNTKLESEIKAKETKKKELEAYFEQVQKTRVRFLQIDEILKTRTNPKKIMEVIARTIPDDVYIDTLQINAKDEITLNGEAQDSRSIGEFIASMNDTPYFGGSISPVKQENIQIESGGITTRVDSFLLSGRIKNYDMRSN